MFDTWTNKRLNIFLFKKSTKIFLWEREREREREREVRLIVGSEEDEWEELQCRWKESKKEWDALGGWVEKKGS